VTLRRLSFSDSRPIHYLLALLALVLLFSGCVKQSRATISSSEPGATAAAQTTQPRANDRQTPAGNQANFATAELQNPSRVNINTASALELEKLPGIGPALAKRIIEHRDKYGPFRRAEHLIIVRGISDRRFRALRDLITVE